MKSHHYIPTRERLFLYIKSCDCLMSRPLSKRKSQFIVHTKLIGSSCGTVSTISTLRKEPLDFGGAFETSQLHYHSSTPSIPQASDTT